MIATDEDRVATEFGLRGRIELVREIARLRAQLAADTSLGGFLGSLQRQNPPVIARFLRFLAALPDDGTVELIFRDGKLHGCKTTDTTYGR